MIAELSGKLVFKGPAEVVIDVGGVGFRMLIPLSTFRALPDEGGTVRVLTHLHVKEDALDLFAFATAAERTIFRELISVSGIGPKLGLAVLSGLSPEVFHRAVIDEDLRLLTSIKGIGKKTAQRMIVELKEKLSGLDVSSIGGVGREREEAGDAVLALVSLGVGRAEAREAVLEAQRDAGCDLSIEELIKRALRKRK
jgi:Holliday junction DNA helicase RuvA